MIGATQDKKILLPYPHPGQQEVLRTARRFNWLAAGRGWYKTTLLASIGVESSFEVPEIFYGAPTYDQVMIAWEEVKRMAYSVFDFNVSRMTVRTPSGCLFIFRSLDDPDNARGYSPKLALIDEARDIKEMAWTDVIRPALFKVGGGAWIASTPARGWFVNGHIDAANHSDAIAWQAPTIGCEIKDGMLIRKAHAMENPSIPFSEAEETFKATPELVFRQEILAEFLDVANAVFRKVDQAATASLQVAAQPKHQYVFGVDWGKYKDFTVITVLDSCCGTLADIDRFNMIDYQVQLARLQTLADKFKPFEIIAESNAMGDPLIEQLQRAGLPVRSFFTGSNKTAMIENLMLAFEKETIRILKPSEKPEAAALIQELKSYDCKRMVSGILRYGAPDGLHDDCVMALALGWQGCSRMPMMFNHDRAEQSPRQTAHHTGAYYSGNERAVYRRGFGGSGRR